MRRFALMIFIFLYFKPHSGLILHGKKKETLGLIQSMREGAQKEVNIDRLDAPSKPDGENLFEDVMSKLSIITRRARRRGEA